MNLRQALHVNRYYRYIGPAEIRAQVRPGSRGRPIASLGDLDDWLKEQAEDEREEPFTFVIDVNEMLLLAPQRSEHIACAGGDPVLSAGEITFIRDQGQWSVHEVSNQSTGYCPDTTSWTAVKAALDRVDLEHPHAFTHPIVFRRCPRCHQCNIVKDDHFVCAICETPLPDTWNMD